MKHKSVTAPDRRGYTGPERNRELDPEQVVWARKAYFESRVSARQLSQTFGMSVDSVRKMLRGDTYANVGAALPQDGEAASVIGKNVDEMAEASAKRLAEMLRAQGGPNTAEPDIGELFAEPVGGGDAAVQTFLNAPKEGENEEGKKK